MSEFTEKFLSGMRNTPPKGEGLQEKCKSFEIDKEVYYLVSFEGRDSLPSAELRLVKGTAFTPAIKTERELRKAITYFDYIDISSISSFPGSGVQIFLPDFYSHASRRKLSPDVVETSYKWIIEQINVSINYFKAYQPEKFPEDEDNLVFHTRILCGDTSIDKIISSLFPKGNVSWDGKIENKHIITHVGYLKFS